MGWSDVLSADGLQQRPEKTPIALIRRAWRCGFGAGCLEWRCRWAGGYGGVRVGLLGWGRVDGDVWMGMCVDVCQKVCLWGGGWHASFPSFPSFFAPGGFAFPPFPALAFPAPPAAPTAAPPSAFCSPAERASRRKAMDLCLRDRLI